jgi:alkylated DNA repair dioxygenase AlkB
VAAQNTLFPVPENVSGPAMPEGFRYQTEWISVAEEASLVASLAALKLEPFEFHGHLGNRRVASFGLRYDYTRRAVEAAGTYPSFLDNLRIKVAEFAGHLVEEFRQLGVNEYRPGAGIGWHRDKSQFGIIVGVSLLSPARMRFRRREGDRWIRMSHIVEPRSAYILDGESRHVWEHSIPPMEALRYSLTFRTLAAEFQDAESDLS